jgi:hypothetical protein
MKQGRSERLAAALILTQVFVASVGRLCGTGFAGARADDSVNTGKTSATQIRS